MAWGDGDEEKHQAFLHLARMPMVIEYRLIDFSVLFARSGSRHIQPA
jgi:hypothetical protein